MGTILYYLTLPFLILTGAIYHILKGITSLVVKAAKFIYEASDEFVRSLVFSYREYSTRVRHFLLEKKEKALFRYFSYFLTTVIAIVFIIIWGSYYFFIVPAGDRAVIVRLGKYNRTLGPGLGMRFPLVERFYIVETEVIREERFGFRQGPSEVQKLKKEILPNEKYVINYYEPKILTSERDNDGYFSTKGYVMNEMNRRQRLTHDYLRQHISPKVKKTKAWIYNAIRKKEALYKNVTEVGDSSDGKITVPTELRMLTGDLNIVEVQWTLQYYIDNAKDYLFNSRDVERNIRDIALAKMNEVIGMHGLKAVITNGRDQIENQVQKKVQAILDQYQLGIKVTQIVILRALPARETLFAFNEVNKASQDLEKYVFYAEAEYMKKVPALKGQAEEIKLKAQAYKIRKINLAEGESKRFTSIWHEYTKAKGITRDRLYIEALDNLYQTTPNIIVSNKVNGLMPIFMSQKKAHQYQKRQFNLYNQVNIRELEDKIDDQIKQLRQRVQKSKQHAASTKSSSPIGSASVSSMNNPPTNAVMPGLDPSNRMSSKVKQLEQNIKKDIGVTTAPKANESLAPVRKEIHGKPTITKQSDPAPISILNSKEAGGSL